MSNDRHGPADGLLAAEIHEAVGTTAASAGLADETGEDPFANLAAVDGTVPASEDLEVVQPPGPLRLSSVTVEDDVTRAFFRGTGPTSDDEIDADDLTVRENGESRRVDVRQAAEAAIDVVFVFDDAGGMYEEVVGAHAAAGPFVDALSEVDLDVRVALVSAKETVELRQDFTDDRSAFVAAVEGLSGSLGRSDRAHGVASLGVATGHTTDANGRTLSPFREGAHRVVISVTDAPALVSGGTTGADYRALDEPNRYRDALAGYTLLEIADPPLAPDGAPSTADLFVPSAGGTWFERPTSSSEHLATLLVEEIPALLAETSTATFTSEVEPDAMRQIELRVESETGGHSITRQVTPRR